MRNSGIIDVLNITMILVGCMIFLGGCVSPKQKLIDSGMEPMGDANYKTLFSKPMKAEYVNSKGMTSSVEYSPDGTMKISNSRITDEGTWRIVNDEQCSTWKTIRKGQEKCFTWFMVGEKTYDVFDSSGMKSGTLTIK